MDNEILEIEFKGRRKEYAANPQQFPFSMGDTAIVTTDRGHDLGKVSSIGLRSDAEEAVQPSLTIVRRASDSDIEKLHDIREKEGEAKRIARRKIREHNLEMKLVDVETQWDGRKMTFYFTADGRVDFRELVKDLASTFRTRIDLRQIGARDETRKTDGYGVCGRPLCCSTFLSEFKPITTQMPRDQFLPLNPTKLSGVCGRLKCCLRYELDIYREFQRNCPKVGHPVKDEIKGEGSIDKLDVVREEIHVKYSGGGFEKYAQSEFMELSNWKPQMPKNECICTCGRGGGDGFVALPEAAKEVERPQARQEGGQRITIGESGLQYDGEGEAGPVDVRTDVKAEDAPKKKRRSRRRREKESGDSSPSSSAERGNHPRKPHNKEEKTAPPAQEPRASRDGDQSTGDPAKRKRRRRGGRRIKKSNDE